MKKVREVYWDILQCNGVLWVVSPFRKTCKLVDARCADIYDDYLVAAQFKTGDGQNAFVVYKEDEA